MWKLLDNHECIGHLPWREGLLQEGAQLARVYGKFSFRTTRARGRSCHFGCGTAMTAASRIAECPTNAFSRSTELIHSPPDLIRSFRRSVIFTYPSESIVTTSPVRNHPSSVHLSGCSRPT